MTATLEKKPTSKIKNTYLKYLIFKFRQFYDQIINTKNSYLKNRSS